MNLKNAEANVKTVEQQLKRVNEEKEILIIDLRKSERALLSAKKVALVERNFLDLVKVLADKRKEKKGHVDEVLKKQVEQNTEEINSLKKKVGCS